jgi:hypothetical protein
MSSPLIPFVLAPALSALFCIAAVGQEATSSGAITVTEGGINTSAAANAQKQPSSRASTLQEEKLGTTSGENKPDKEPATEVKMGITVVEEGPLQGIPGVPNTRSATTAANPASRAPMLRHQQPATAAPVTTEMLDDCTPSVDITDVIPASGASVSSPVTIKYTVKMMCGGSGNLGCDFYVREVIETFPAPSTLVHQGTNTFSVECGQFKTINAYYQRPLDPGTYKLTIEVRDRGCTTSGDPPGSSVIAAVIRTFTVPIPGGS